MSVRFIASYHSTKLLNRSRNRNAILENAEIYVKYTLMRPQLRSLRHKKPKVAKMDHFLKPEHNKAFGY
jgi:hypothetical protein